MTTPTADPLAGDGRVRLSDDVTVVVPVRNAALLLEDCLRSVLACRPAAVVVVDGLSTDRTREMLRDWPVTVLSDEGKGLPAARLLGAQAATTSLVALVDVDVVLPHPDALEDLAAEFLQDGWTGLQAGLESTSGPGYWGRAMVDHHRNGRSRSWFGLVCTVLRRDVLLEHGFDADFVSGEDIELRWRLRAAGARLGVSSRTVVQHRFAGDDLAFAKDQFLMDGRGLGRMVRQQRLRGAGLALLPLAAAVRGALLCLRPGKVQYVPYYVLFALYNYLGMLGLR